MNKDPHSAEFNTVSPKKFPTNYWFVEDSELIPLRDPLDHHKIGTGPEMALDLQMRSFFNKLCNIS